MTDLGQAKKITVDKDNTTVIEGKGKHNEIEGRVKEIRSQVKKTTSDYDREKLQERLAKLVGGVAVINNQLLAKRIPSTVHIFASSAGRQKALPTGNRHPLSYSPSSTGLPFPSASSEAVQ
jgi:hypothetical protein